MGKKKRNKRKQPSNHTPPPPFTENTSGEGLPPLENAPVDVGEVVSIGAAENPKINFNDAESMRAALLEAGSQAAGQAAEEALQRRCENCQCILPPEDPYAVQCNECKEINGPTLSMSPEEMEEALNPTTDKAFANVAFDAPPGMEGYQEEIDQNVSQARLQQLTGYAQIKDIQIRPMQVPDVAIYKMCGSELLSGKGVKEMDNVFLECCIFLTLQQLSLEDAARLACKGREEVVVESLKVMADIPLEEAEDYIKGVIMHLGEQVSGRMKPVNPDDMKNLSDAEKGELGATEGKG